MFIYIFLLCVTVILIVFTLFSDPTMNICRDIKVEYDNSKLSISSNGQSSHSSTKSTKIQSEEKVEKIIPTSTTIKKTTEAKTTH